MDKRPILISVAMESEFLNLLNKIDKKIEKKILDYRVFEGEISSYPVVIVETKVGLVNTAIILTKVIDMYKPC